jgi:hypothetical protein
VVTKAPGLFSASGVVSLRGDTTPLASFRIIRKNRFHAATNGVAVDFSEMRKRLPTQKGMRESLELSSLFSSSSLNDS